LFDIYEKLFSVNNENKLVYISRQSVYESLLPGINCLKDIFLHNVINSNSQNEYVQRLDELIHKTELLYTVSNSEYHIGSNIGLTSTQTISQDQSLPSINLINNNSINSITNTANAISDLVSSGVTENANFKSFVFKGITNSKDKLSNFYKTVKK
jgi:hypothetical protein